MRLVKSWRLDSLANELIGFGGLTGCVEIDVYIWDLS
jgi:hypothetical protein